MIIFHNLDLDYTEIKANKGGYIVYGANFTFIK